MKTRRIDREHLEAKTLMNRVRIEERRRPELQRFFHVPNGGARGKAAAGKLKAEGVRPGVPDYLLPVPRVGFVGLAIELKAKGGTASSEQKDWLAHLEAVGWRVAVCVGWEAAWQALDGYLRIPAAVQTEVGQ
jgi:hypothetical protein